MAKQFSESKHLRGQPGNAGQFRDKPVPAQPPYRQPSPSDAPDKEAQALPRRLRFLLDEAVDSDRRQAAAAVIGHYCSTLYAFAMGDSDEAERADRARVEALAELAEQPGG